VLVVSSPEPSGVSWQAIFAPWGDIECERLSWQVATPERFANGFELVVAAPGDDADSMRRMLEWLRIRPPGLLILAVLPELVETELLDVVCWSTDDFVILPVRVEELYRRIDRLVRLRSDEVRNAQERIFEDIGLGQFVFHDPRSRQVLEQIRRIALFESTVLITGETGTGKEVSARAIHHLGRRRNQPFIPVDCAAVPDHLFESELFGYMRGAFTDAHADRKGLVAMADGGSLFLDEVDSLSMLVQAKLLRILQERQYRPLGSDRFLRVDINIIAASNTDLKASVAAGRFRADLYFRLNVLRLALPALRERPLDIPVLAEQFLASGRGGAMRPSVFSSGAVTKLCAYSWPGNVRELWNVVQRALLLSDGGCILPCHITFSEEGFAETGEDNFRRARARAIETFERNYIVNMLHKHGGNVTRAAKAAGQERRAFGRLAKKYALTAPPCETAGGGSRQTRTG
jgi:DNA-binding NtrC family response regulator